MQPRVLILGAGQAGAQVAMSLRQANFSGEVVLVGSEPHLPYQRPPLSKQVLKREWDPERCHLRHLAYYEQHDVQLMLGREAVALDVEGRKLGLDDGSEASFDVLALCTGARLNRLPVPGTELAGVYYLRTIDDSLELAANLGPGARLVVIGGGYIGMEVAAAARFRGCEVVVIEAASQIMQRSALPEIAEFLQHRHQQEGVQILLNRSVKQLVGNDAVDGIVLDDGTVIDADFVMIGVGVNPNIAWLAGSGLDFGRGIRVDRNCNTNIDGIYAAGDVAELQHPALKGWHVLESVQNAVSQGKLVASNILGLGETYQETPWFWSEQFDCRLQMAGIPRASDKHVIRRIPETGGISVFSVQGNVIHAVQSIHSPRDYMVGRQLIARRTAVLEAQLEDSHFNLKDLL